MATNPDGTPWTEAQRRKLNPTRGGAGWQPMPVLDGRPATKTELRGVRPRTFVYKLALRWYLLWASIRGAARDWLGLDADLRDLRNQLEAERQLRAENDATLQAIQQTMANQLDVISKILPAANQAGARLRYYEATYPPLANLKKKHDKRVMENDRKRKRAAEETAVLDGAPRVLTLDRGDDDGNSPAPDGGHDDHRGVDPHPEIVPDGAELDAEGEVRPSDVPGTDAHGEAEEGGGVRGDAPSASEVTP